MSDKQKIKIGDKTVDKLADKVLEKMKSSESHKDEIVGTVKERAGESEAEKTLESIERSEQAAEEKSKSELRHQLRAALTGQTQGQKVTDIGTEDQKAYFGSPHDNAARLDKGYRHKNSMATRALGCMSHVMATKGNSTQFWPLVRDTASGRGYKDVADTIDKELQEGDLTAGGAAVPEPLAEQFIEFNYDSSVVRSFPVRTVDMSDGSIDFGNVTSTTSGSWSGETAAINASQLNTGKRKLEAKKLRVYTIISNDLMRRAVDGFEQIVEDDLRMAISLEEDLSFLRGDGQNGKPKGIKQQAVSGNKFANRSSPGSQATKSDIIGALGTALEKVEGNNISVDNAGWAMRTQTKNGIVFRSGDDDIYAEMVLPLLEGNLLGYPVQHTNQIPNDLDASGEGDNDETEIYFGAWDQVIIGDTLNMNMRAENTGTVNKSDGTDYNLLTRDSTAMIITHETDILLRHPESFAVIEEVDYFADLT